MSCKRSPLRNLASRLGAPTLSVSPQPCFLRLHSKAPHDCRPGSFRFRRHVHYILWNQELVGAVENQACAFCTKANTAQNPKCQSLNPQSSLWLFPLHDIQLTDSRQSLDHSKKQVKRHIPKSCMPCRMNHGICWATRMCACVDTYIIIYLNIYIYTHTNDKRANGFRLERKRALQVWTMGISYPESLATLVESLDSGSGRLQWCTLWY